MGKCEVSHLTALAFYVRVINQEKIISEILQDFI